jgi:putative aldouronate transport system substrate-binding protein
MQTKKMSITLKSCLILLLAFSVVLTGCTGNNGATTNNGNAVPASSTNNKETNEELKPYEISLFYPGTPQKDVEVVEAEVNKYLKDKINATLQINAIDWGQWDNKLNLMVNANEKADIIFTAAWQNYTVNVARGAFLPVNDLLEKHGKNILENLDPAFILGSKIEGKNYGVPTNKELAATRGVLIREDLVKKHNIDLSNVKTWTDLEPILKTIKENEPDVTPFFISNSTGNGILDNLDWDYLGDATVPGVVRKIGSDTTVYNALETPEYLEAAALIRKWYQAGYVNSDAATSTVFPRDQAKTGKVFMWTDGLKPGKDAEEEGYVGFDLTQVELTEPTITTGDASGSMLAISRTSEDPERAMMFLNLLHSDKYLNNLINFGIEGTHYEKVSDEIKKPGPKNKDYNPGAMWQLGNQFLNYLGDHEDPKKWEKFKDFNSRGVKSPALGFAFNSEPVKNEIAACRNVSEQYDPALTSGAVDPDQVIPEYLAKLKASGIDKIIAEKQRQLDAFLASQ